MQAEHRVVTRPSGWNGRKGDRFFYKATAYGVRSMCTSCGSETHGWADDNNRKHHRADCPRITGPRKEWKGYVDATGKACVHRLDAPNAEAYETQMAALFALDAELVAQAEHIARQRAEVAKMIAEATP